MDRIIIKGGQRLSGQVPISGAKNSALPIMAASLLTDQPCTLRGVPDLRDIKTMGRLLEILGVDRKPAGQGQPDGSMTLQTSATDLCEAPYNQVKTMRASVLVLGPLVARRGWARVSLPGGCAIGARPINLHLKGLAQMGGRVELSGGYIFVQADRLKGAKITFERVSVTGTENLIMAAALAEGRSVLANAAQEPEVVDLCQALASMGARIEGAGTDRIVIEGVERLAGFDHRVMPDRIETGTYLIAAAITGSRLTLTGTRPQTLAAVSDKLGQAGVEISAEADRIVVDATNQPLAAVDCRTAPYPGFPTDMQAQFMALMCLARGTSVITETIFENRFMHVSELLRLGAKIQLDGRQAVVKGVGRLSGAPVMATDLRASASLIVAGLAAAGETVVRRVYHLDRGYEALERKLSAVGAIIRREKDE